MNRRAFLVRNSLAVLGMTVAGETLAGEMAAEPPVRGPLGIATTSYMMAWKPKDTLEFLEHCHALGAAGIQSAMHGDPAKVREQAERYGMYVEVMVPMPKPGDTGAFEKALQDAKAAGAVALRSACLGSRRYETFRSLSQWQEHVSESHAAIEAALPLLDRYKIPLGLENHKDWTGEEAAAIFQKYGTEYFGSCLDFGNNLSLLNEPMDVIEKLAPYAICVHLKDMGTAPDKDGFLLSEVLLGQGYIDLPKAVSLVKKARPQARLSLEMITRDPLHVPCFEDSYWVTFPDRKGIDLARTLRFVEQHTSANPLPRFAQLSHEDWMKAEDQNVVACLNWARANLANV